MEENISFTAGKRGTTVRSDCWVEFEPRDTGGNVIELKSKVGRLYGDKITALLNQVLDFYGIENCVLRVEDSGALDFVLAARVETALKRAGKGLGKEFLLPANYGHLTPQKVRLRRSRLYLPGNEPKFYINAGLHKPDGLILDLEDSVHHSEKDAARILVRNALRAVNFYGAERMVRINQLPMGLEDLRSVIPNGAELILIPKCEIPHEVELIDDEIFRIKQEYNIKHPILLMPIIESAKGISNAQAIAAASDNICALTIGLEDFSADLGVERTLEGRESFYARSVIINTAKAAGIQAIDSVFSDVEDTQGLINSVLEAKGLGFEGKGCIHPRQIDVIHKAFAPSEKEIEKAKKIVLAFEDAQSKGLGVISLGSKMIDPPVVKRALHTVDLALLNGLLSGDWRNNENG